MAETFDEFTARLRAENEALKPKGPRVYTNNHWRDFTYRSDVPEAVLKSDFDWTTEDDIDGFFCYKGVWYHTSQFMRFGYPPGGEPPALFKGWHGYLNDSFHSGVVIRMSDDGEQFQVGTFF